MPERYRREIRFWGRSLDRDADDELRFHIEMRTAELMERGLSEADARAEAVRAFGSLPAVKAEVRHIDRQTARHVRWTTWLADLRQDVVAGLRQFRKAPGFTAAAVLTIALGIGATTAIFGVVHAVVLRPLPFAEPDRIAFVTEFWRDQRSDVSVGNFVDWRAAFDRRLLAPGGHQLHQPERRRRLGARARAGRPGLARVLRAVRHGAAARTRAARRRGQPRPRRRRRARVTASSCSASRPIRRWSDAPFASNGRPHVVVGVMPEAFDYLADNGACGCPPVHPGARGRARRALPHRLRPAGARRHVGAGARTAWSRWPRDLEKRYPQDNAGVSARVTPDTEWLVEDVRLRLFTWLGAVACVLLIACANVANLLLARGTGRARELAVRASLGASRWRIVRQLLAESLVLSAAGAVGGVAIASWATQLLAVRGLPRCRASSRRASTARCWPLPWRSRSPAR